MDCPVCNRTEISPFATNCPGCRADLVVFPLLDDLEEQCVDTLKDKIAAEGDMASLIQQQRFERKEFIRKRNYMYLFLFLFPLMFFWCGKKSIISSTTDNSELNLEIQQLKEEKENLQLIINKKDKRISELENKKIINYVIEKGDKLSLLSQKYYGDMERWVEIMELNPEIKNPNKLIPGDTIKIKIEK